MNTLKKTKFQVIYMIDQEGFPIILSCNLGFARSSTKLYRANLRSALLFVQKFLDCKRTVSVRKRDKWCEIEKN